MSNKSLYTAVRLVPRSQDFLDRYSGERGEIFFDENTNTLRLYDSNLPGGFSLAKDDLSNVSQEDFIQRSLEAGLGSTSVTVNNTAPLNPNQGNLWLNNQSGILYIYYQDGTSNQWVQPASIQYGTSAGGSGGGSASNSFTTFKVAGQSDVVADSATDTLTLVAGTNISLTTDAGTDTITINATAVEGTVSNSFTTFAVAGQSNVVADSSTDTLTLIAGANVTITTNAGNDSITISAAAGEGGTPSNSFTTIAVPGQSNVVADSNTDTLTIVAGTGISIATNAGTDTITITSTVAAGATAFTGLSDAAGLTVDRFYLPAITMLTVTNNSASSYRYDQYGATDNPTIYAINGTTIAFNLNVAGHPFLIQTSGGSNYNEGLTHVTTAGVVTTGASAQGKTSGTLYWKIPASISGNYRYICSIHTGAMVGTIVVKNFVSI